MIGMVTMIASVAASTATSVAVSTAVNWFLGPRERARETVRQEGARRSLQLRLQLLKVLQEIARDLAKREALHLNRKTGQAVCKTLMDYQRALLPVVRALDDPDLGRKVSAKLRTGLVDLLGLYRFEHLEICATEEDIKPSLDQYAFRRREQHHLKAFGLLPAMYQDTGASELVVTARKRVKELIKLLA